MPDILHKYFSSVWQHLPKFCWNQSIICGLVWSDSAEQLSVTVKIILALFCGRLKDGVRNKYIYSLQTSLKGAWNKSWLIRKNKIVEVQDKIEGANFCWTNISVILTCCVLARFPFVSVDGAVSKMCIICFVLFSFLSWECCSK